MTIFARKTTCSRKSWAHAAFRDAYGPISDADERLARFRALDVAAAVLKWGLDAGNPVAERAGRTTIARLLRGLDASRPG